MYAGTLCVFVYSKISSNIYSSPPSISTFIKQILFKLYFKIISLNVIVFTIISFSFVLVFFICDIELLKDKVSLLLLFCPKITSVCLLYIADGSISIVTS